MKYNQSENLGGTPLGTIRNSPSSIIILLTVHKKTGRGSYLSFLQRRTENKGITYKKQQADNKKKIFCIIGRFPQATIEASA